MGAVGVIEGGILWVLDQIVEAGGVEFVVVDQAVELLVASRRERRG